jgi:hypothetical protein
MQVIILGCFYYHDILGILIYCNVHCDYYIAMIAIIVNIIADIIDTILLLI